jgi:hypothetical protein
MTTSAGPPAPLDGRAIRVLALVLVGAMALRVGLAVALPNVLHPDETFQYLEQAHRAAFGYGIVPWEYAVGARSWLLPGALTPVMALAGALGLGPDFYLPAVAATMSALSLSIVVASFLWGLRTDLLHAVVAGVVSAVWFQLVYFAPKTLTEVVAANFLIVGLYLSEGLQTRRRLVAIGALFGFAFAFRFHLAPAVAVAALMVAAPAPRERAVPLAVGAAGPVLLLGLVDWYTWGHPFQSVAANFHTNVVEGRASNFGTDPFYFYFEVLALDWSGALVPIVALALYGARRRPLPLVTAGVIFISHSFIPHKEHRFLYPAVACIIVLAGLGTAEIVDQIAWTRSSAARRRTAMTLAAAAWAVTSVVLAASYQFLPNWVADGRLRAMTELSRHSDLCGVGLDFWEWTGGYSRLHKNVPLYDLKQYAADTSPSMLNAIIAPRSKAPPPSWGYTTAQCFDGKGGFRFVTPETCIFVRPGSCTPDPGGGPNRL